MSKQPETSSTAKKPEAGKKAEKETPAPLSMTDTELEKLLNREATALNRDIECERILSSFKFNPYEVLDIDENCTPEQVKKRYRQLSLFIHPDKLKHPRAPEAFDLLKKAESELSDPKKREELDAVIGQARILVLKAAKLPTTIEHDDPRLKALEPPFRVQMRARSKELLIHEEARRRTAIKMNLANEGLEARRVEAEALAKKRKAEDDKIWEETREQRVGSWRNFANGKKKKQKTNKPAVLG